MAVASGLPRGKSTSGDESHWDFFDRIYFKDPQLYHQILKETFNHTKPYEAKAYKLLVQIPFRSFVTLNHDELLPNAFYEFTLKRKPKCNFSVYPGKHPIYLPSDFSEINQCLVAIHGCKNQSDDIWYENLILRWTDYKTHYEGDGPHPTFLQMWWYWLLTTSPCIFIGTSLKEPGVALTIAKIAEHSNESVRRLKHIHLTDEPGITFGVLEEIVYDNINKEHTGLVDVLSLASGIKESGPSVTEFRKVQMTSEFSVGNNNPANI